ncbi:MAG: hypothetical protein ACD_39C01441G0002 [uncultured bacterium]|nr:MAG: hypothetical protein ACD_39C01441G0002 [uncultured bacterium]
MKWLKAKPDTETGDGCMTMLTRMFLLLFPTLFIGLGIHLFLKNREALSWPTTPIIITGSEARSTYSEDSETKKRTYSVEVKLYFSGHFEGHSISGFFIRSAEVGDDEPPPAIIEQKQRELLTQYQRDGLVAHVNPADTTQTMVEPSLIGPIIMMVFGLLLLVFIVRQQKQFLTD